jgi:hypothetical protein
MTSHTQRGLARAGTRARERFINPEKKNPGARRAPGISTETKGNITMPGNTESIGRTQEQQEEIRKANFLARQKWIDGVQCRSDLTPAARLIGGRVGWHKNLETGQCNPGYGTLADESGYPTRTAIRAIAELERAGSIRVNRTSGGRGSNSNSYTLIPHPATATSVTTTRVSKRVTRVKTRSAPVSPQHPNLKENIGPSGGRERRACFASFCYWPGDGALEERPRRDSCQQE